MGGYPHAAALESVLAVALTLRGAEVDILLCDSFLPACQLTKIGASTMPEQLIAERIQPRCRSCFQSGKETFEPLGLPIYWYSQLVTAEQAKAAEQIAESVSWEEIGNYELDGLAVGEHASAGALRYFARGDLENEPQAEAIARRYLRAALLTVYAVREILNRNAYDAACFHHGIYVPQGLIGEVCRQRGVRVVNWNPAYRKHCFIFSHGDSYHHTMISEPTSVWDTMGWRLDLEAMTLEYLKSRWQGTQDWIWFHEKPQEDVDTIAKETGIDFSRPCIGLLTNVMWDARLHYKSNAFPDMLAWVLETISYFAKRPELQLVIRVHPAEVRGATPSRQPLAPEIRRAFPVLPGNVFVVPPESQVSTYALMEKCNAVIIYNTKTGIEVSSMGIPVIVAGEAWIRGKGFSLDASDPTGYFQLLDRLPLPDGLTPEELERARKYAFHFFFRRMIELPFIREDLTLDVDSLEALGPGRFRGLDVICDGILTGAPFVLRAEGE
ncbi:MAG: capsule biosynthesis protein [Chloroflexi bacterium]|nr:capsule biosynthesis protein [Chloroflexota bacterium]